MDEENSSVNCYNGFLKPELIPQRKHPHPSQLPQTVTILKDLNTNATVYLVGTAHFSEKSQREVTEVSSIHLKNKLK